MKSSKALARSPALSISFLFLKTHLSIESRNAVPFLRHHEGFVCLFVCLLIPGKTKLMSIIYSLDLLHLHFASSCPL